MIGVLGSANMDIVVQVTRIPRPGETVHGTGIHWYPGGKGANQAVAAARLGAQVEFFGKVGADAFGEELLGSLAESGVDASDVERVEDCPTGVACVLVDSSGENAILFVPGANAAVDSDYVDRIYDRLAAVDVLLVQFEIPFATIAHLLARLPENRPLVIVDPAPVLDIDELPLARIDVLTPNRGELAALAGTEDVERGARALLRRGVRQLVCKAGEDGAYWIGGETVRVPAPKVKPIDTTAAGDAFNGALACAILERPLLDAVRWASVAGALATTRRGAQPSLPRRKEVQRLFERA